MTMRTRLLQRLKRPDVDTDQLARLYTEQHLTLRAIAARVGISAQAVRARLLRVGITARDGTHVTRRCAFCGVLVERVRCKARRVRVYCTAEHYYADLGQSGYLPHRHSSRLARAIVAQHVTLLPEHIVHHVDGNQRHNDLANLWVFASQADHMAHHRGRAVEPLWRGAAG